MTVNPEVEPVPPENIIDNILVDLCGPGQAAQGRHVTFGGKEALENQTVFLVGTTGWERACGHD